MQKNIEQIAQLYNKKVSDSDDINYIIAKDDKRFFNHSGIVRNPASIRKIKVNNKTLHQMELDLVILALDFMNHLTTKSLVLDAGCGSGGSTMIIQKKFNCRIEGFDVSAKQIERAESVSKEGNFASCTFQVGNMLQLPREDNYYDFIFSCESSEHVNNLNTMFKEFKRVVKPTGQLMTIAWSSVNSPLGRRIKSQIDKLYLTSMHSREEYINSAKLNGWKILEEKDLTLLTLPYWQARASTSVRTGSEIPFIEGYSSRNLSYMLIKYGLGK